MNDHILSLEEKQRRRRFFRGRIVLSMGLLVVGALLFYLGNQGLLFFLSAEAILLISVGCIVVGLLLSMTLLRCPYCGEPIHHRSPFVKFFYVCPHCDFRADGSNLKPQTQAAPVEIAAEEAPSSKKPFLQVSEAHFRQVAIGLWVLILLWLALAVLLWAVGSLNKFALYAMVAAGACLVVAIRTLRCPVCGALVSEQVPLWGFPNFKCKQCNYSVK